MHTNLICFLGMIALLFTNGVLYANDINQPSAPPLIKVLIVTGGHGFDVKEFYQMFDDMQGITYDKAELPKNMGMLAPGLEKEYDIIVSYDMNTFPVTEEQLADYAKLLETGIPLLAFHHTIGGYTNWPLYTDIIGGKYLYKTEVFDGQEYPASTYKHDLEMSITVVDKKHPITQGIDDFVILDEGYKGMYVKPDVHLLLVTDHPDATKEVAWTYKYGKSPVFTIVLGHDKHAYANTNLRKLLKQGIDWAVSETVKNKKTD